MKSLDEILADSEIREEYKKAVLLNIFRKIWLKCEKDPSFKKKFYSLLRESTSKVKTIKGIILKETKIDLVEEDVLIIEDWINAYQRKKTNRKGFSREFKLNLVSQQNGICPLCGNLLPDDISKINVDHIIPWIYVGDELENNYKALCEHCNKSKGANILYVFNKLINLI